MSIEAAVRAGRDAAEALLLDTFAAQKFTTTTVDGLQEQSWVTQYTTPGKVSGRSRESDTKTRTVTVGGVERPVLEGGVHIPMSKPLPAIGWRFLCTAVDASSDPSLVGRAWRVEDVPAKSFATARRLDVVEVAP